MRKIKLYHLIFTVFISLQLSGCASLVSGPSESLSVETKYQGRPVDNAKCKLSNDKGRWYVTTPGSVVVHRSFAALKVNCEKEGLKPGNLTIDSTTKKLAFGNILFGGVVGGVVDVGTGAAYDYPILLTVTMGQTQAIMAGPAQANNKI